MSKTDKENNIADFSARFRSCTFYSHCGLKFAVSSYKVDVSRRATAILRESGNSHDGNFVRSNGFATIYLTVDSWIENPETKNIEFLGWKFNIQSVTTKNSITDKDPIIGKTATIKAFAVSKIGCENSIDSDLFTFDAFVEDFILNSSWVTPPLKVNVPA